MYISELGTSHFFALPRHPERVVRWNNYYPFWSSQSSSFFNLELERGHPSWVKFPFSYLNTGEGSAELGQVPLLLS